MKLQSRMRFLKFLLSIGVLFAIIVGSAFTADAMSRADIAKIKVGRSGHNFKYWQKNSVAKAKLIKYVRAITDRDNAAYIPVDDRIAVFDLDGTLISETTPTYFEWMVYFERIYNDPSFHPTPQLLENAQLIKSAIAEHAVTDVIDSMEAQDQATILAGLNHKQMRELVNIVLNRPVDGMQNLKRGESIYLPMAEVVSYLQANQFTVYLVSGAMREVARVFVDGALPIKPNNIIGADIMTEMTYQGTMPKSEYVFQKGRDEVLRTGKIISENTGINKVIHIDREIGKQPVLAFGNSSGDYSMFEYTLSNNRYKSMVFSLCCDDLEREYGNLKKAEKMQVMCKKQGWVPISMKNDWNTIYGENVFKEVAAAKKRNTY